MNTGDIVYHSKTDKMFQVNKPYESWAMCFEMNDPLDKIPSTDKRGRIQTNVDGSITYKKSLLRIENLTIL